MSSRPEIINSRPAVTAKRISRLEAWLGHTLPSAYRDFLLQHNGGQPQPATFAPTGRSEPTEAVHQFLAVDGDPESDDLAAFLKLFRKRVPAGWLPVAYDHFGNLICLALEGKDRGSVHLWLHEDGRTQIVAKDWEEFMKSFQPPHGGEEQPTSRRQRKKNNGRGGPPS